MNVINLNERRLSRADALFEKRVVLPRAEIALLLKIAEARAIIEAKEKRA
jgi:hypothetical protein